MFIVAEQICLAFHGLHFEVRRVRLIPLIEDSGDFIDLFIKRELTRPFVSLVARIGINPDGERHRVSLRGIELIPDNGLRYWFRSAKR